MFDKMAKFFIDTVTFSDVSQSIVTIVGIVAFTLFYYFVIKFLLSNEARYLVILFVLVSLLVGFLVMFADTLNSSIFLLVPAIFGFSVLLLYTVEIKRLILNRKAVKKAENKRLGSSYDKEKIEEATNEIIKALQNMSKNDVGAIIILASASFPSQILDSGVKIDSDISSALIESVFFPKTPLHDGAMIINGTKIVSAGCFLPLSQNVDNIPKELGTRHRAGIGVTETVDVVSLIVSEETGVISIAKEGKITRYADSEMIKKTLNRYYWEEMESSKR